MILTAAILSLAQGPSSHSEALPPPKVVKWCRGIHMPNGTPEGVNLLWTTIRGPKDRLQPIRRRMERIGARIHVEGWDEDGAQIRAAYQDNLDAKAIARLLNEIDAGKHGPVTTEDYAMSADTLPAGKCIRLR